METPDEQSAKGMPQNAATALLSDCGRRGKAPKRAQRSTIRAVQLRFNRPLKFAVV